jgi:hypothetical protein
MKSDVINLTFYNNLANSNYTHKYNIERNCKKLRNISD